MDQIDRWTINYFLTTLICHRVNRLLLSETKRQHNYRVRGFKLNQHPKGRLLSRQHNYPCPWRSGTENPGHTRRLQLDLELEHSIKNQQEHTEGKETQLRNTHTTRHRWNIRAEQRNHTSRELDWKTCTETLNTDYRSHVPHQSQSVLGAATEQMQHKHSMMAEEKYFPAHCH